MTGSKTTRREFLTKACELSAAGVVTAFAWGSLSLRDANARWMPRPPGAVDGKDFLALCLRCGQCVTSCPYDTLKLAGPFDPAPGGTPFFDPEKIPCYMCKDLPCVKACPRNIIELRNKGVKDRRVFVCCVNKDKGNIARKACTAACIGCGKCAKECPFEAITLENNLAYIDFRKCRLCRKCVSVCPTHAIHEVNFPPRKITEPADQLKTETN